MLFHIPGGWVDRSGGTPTAPVPGAIRLFHIPGGWVGGGFTVAPEPEPEPTPDPVAVNVRRVLRPYNPVRSTEMTVAVARRSRSLTTREPEE